jgi:DNA polymerase I-like protein with 3'-5' exonuclease and polymerase domains
LITIDFETYYAADYSLSKVTTEEYVRDPRFQVIGVSVKVNNDPAEWFTGDMEETAEWLAGFDWDNHFVLAHNAMFDAAILTWVFGQKPKAWLDTLSMARAILGTQVGGSLGKLVEHFGLGTKGFEVNDAKGLRREDFGAQQLAQYGEYCKNDVELTYKLYNEMSSFPTIEKRLIDITIRMFSDPLLELDVDKLESHLVEVKERKEKLFVEANITKEVLNSSAKFAELLIANNVRPPIKISPATGKDTYAFAKSDGEFMALLEHPNETVQALVAARVGAKSTLEETRTERFISIARRGHIGGALRRLPIPLKYYAAHTGRWGGSDKVNLQNLPSRGTEGGKLKRCIVAPRGHVIIDCDSSQIEARVLAWLAGQNDVLNLFATKQDVYRHMASNIFSVYDINKVTPEQRFIGKTTVLGAGYGMGGVKFQAQLSTMGKNVDLDMCKFIIKQYRASNPNISKWWNHLTLALDFMMQNKELDIDSVGLLTLEPFTGISLPNGLMQNYPELTRHSNGDYTYQTRMGPNKIYGGKVAENLCQAVARCIIGEQIVQIEKRYRVVLTVHDAIACVVHEDEAHEARAYIEECMRTPPAWAQGLPLDCESGMARNYGDC